MNVVKKIIYGETNEDGSHSFHIVTRGGACYGRLYDGEWAYVHYNAHQSGTDYMTDVPKKTLLDLVRGKMNWATFESHCYYWWQKEQEEMRRFQEADEKEA